MGVISYIHTHAHSLPISMAVGVGVMWIWINPWVHMLAAGHLRAVTMA